MKNSFSAVAAIVLSLLSLNVQARSWRINSDPAGKANFLSINDAMESLDVFNGDTLYLDPGCVLGSQTVSKSVTIIGTGYNLQNDATREAIISNITIKASNVKIEGCNISSTIECKEMNANNISIERCRLNTYKTTSFNKRNHKITSCYVCSEISLDNTEGCEISNCIITGQISNINSGSIKNNTILYYDDNAYHFLTNIKNSSITNNIILHVTDKYAVDENQKPYYNRNYTISNVSPADNNVINNNVLSTDAEHAFANFPQNKFIGAKPEDVFTLTGTAEELYRLKDDSPAKGYGTNGYDCGAYSGQYPYVLSGHPRFIPYIYEAIIPNYPTDGKLNVTLKIKSQNE